MGILGNFVGAVTLVNRTSRVLSCRYDGEDVALQPGENHGFPREAAPFAKRQNPLMGSKHPLNPLQFISLVGIKDIDDCSPISDEVMLKADGKLEVVDRDGEFYDEPMGKVQLLRKKKRFDAYEAHVGGTGIFDGDNKNIQ